MSYTKNRLFDDFLIFTSFQSTVRFPSIIQRLCKISILIYKRIHFNLFYMIQYITVLSFLTSIILSFHASFFSPQNIPILASGSNFKVVLQSLWCNPSNLWQIPYFLVLQDVSDVIEVISIKSHRSLAELKIAIQVTCYYRLRIYYKAFLSAEQ